MNVRNKQDNLKYLYMPFYLNKNDAKHHLDTFTQLLKSIPKYPQIKQGKKYGYYKGFNKKKVINKHILQRKSLKLINAFAKFTQT